MMCECSRPSSRMRWYILRSRFSTAGCAISYEGLLASSAFASLDFLSAADSVNAKQNKTAVTTNSRFFARIFIISSAERKPQSSRMFRQYESRKLGYVELCQTPNDCYVLGGWRVAPAQPRFLHSRGRAAPGPHYAPCSSREAAQECSPQRKLWVKVGE